MVRGAAVIFLMLAVWSGPASAAGTLYDDLGGRDRIVSFTSELVDIAVADERIKAKFDDINLVRLKQRLADQFCQLTGGPEVYKGRGMAESHKGLALRNADFNALVEDLQTAMDHAGIPFFTQNRLLALLAPMQREIVTK